MSQFRRRLAEASRSAARLGRELWALLAGILLVHLGWYLVLPFVAVLLTTRRGLTPAQAGLVLAASSLTFQAGSLLGGPLADRAGRRVTMLAGLALRAAGLVGLGAFARLPALLAAATVLGVGGGLFAPAAKAGIAALAAPETRSTAFSLRGMAANLGVSLGPVIGGLLLGRGPLAMFAAAAGVHLALAALLAVFLTRDCEPPVPAGCGPAAAPRRGVRELPDCGGPDPAAMFREAVQDRPFLAFSALSALIWALFTQLTLAVPLRAVHILPSPGQIGYLWTLSSIGIVLFQVPVTRWASRHLHPLTAVAAGTVLLGAGLGTVAWASSFWHLTGAVAIFVLGEMLVVPTVDSVVSQLARPRALATYFGVAAFVWGLGEGAGNLAGGLLMSRVAPAAPALPWAIMFAAGLALGAGARALRSWPALQTALRQAAAQPDAPAAAPVAQPYAAGTPAAGPGDEPVPAGGPGGRAGP